MGERGLGRGSGDNSVLCFLFLSAYSTEMSEKNEANNQLPRPNKDQPSPAALGGIWVLLLRLVLVTHLGGLPTVEPIFGERSSPPLETPHFG